jgi:hypothetical protein
MTREKIIRHVIGYKPEFVKDSEVSFEVINQSRIKINWNGMERTFEVFLSEWNPIDLDDEFDEDVAYCFTTEDLMHLFSHFREVNVCNDCLGTGYYEQREECYKPSSECCGGCYQKVLCDCRDLIFPVL